MASMGLIWVEPNLQTRAVCLPYLFVGGIGGRGVAWRAPELPKSFPDFKQF